MLIRDEDSYDKWCPMMRLFNPVQKVSGHNVTIEVEDGEETGCVERGYAQCLGSDCMMWRRDRDPELGYCGLAGKPTEVF